MQDFDKSFWTIPDLTEGFYSEQVKQFIIEHISTGVLRPNDPIPPYRLLSEWNRLHRNTVNMIYQSLQRDRWIYTIPGHGTFISENFPGYENVYKSRKVMAKLPVEIKAKKATKEQHEPLTDFTTIGFDTPSPEYFPVWHYYKFMKNQTHVYRRLNQMDRVVDLQGLAYKEAIHRYLDVTRLFSIDASNLEVILGRRQSLYRVLNTLLQQNDFVVNTAPKDTMIYQVFKEIGVSSYHMDIGEVDFITKLSDFLDQHKINAIYLRPQCSYPENHHLLPLACEQLIDLAKKHSFYIIEEDDYHEFWYEPRPFKELTRYDHNGHVIYLGALSLLSPYMQQTRTVVAAPEFIQLMKNVPAQKFEFRDILEERVITDLLNSKKIWKYINILRTEKKNHLQQIWMEMDNYLRLGVKVNKPSSGLALWLNFPSDVSLQESMDLIVAAKKEIPYHPDGVGPGPGIANIRLGFGSWEIHEAQNAAKLLHEKFVREYGKNY